MGRGGRRRRSGGVRLEFDVLGGVFDAFLHTGVGVVAIWRWSPVLLAFLLKWEFVEGGLRIFVLCIGDAT